METYIQYKSNIEPKISLFNRRWLDDIFNGTKEQENIMYQNNNFLLIHELNKLNIDNIFKPINDIINMHYLVFFKDIKLRSIRDININNISMISKSINKCIGLIRSKYKLKYNINFNIEFHYHPSIWQLHAHIYIKYIGKNNIHKNKFLGCHKSVYNFFTIKKNILIDYNFYKYESLKIN